MLLLLNSDQRTLLLPRRRKTLEHRGSRKSEMDQDIVWRDNQGFESFDGGVDVSSASSVSAVVFLAPSAL